MLSNNSVDVCGDIDRIPNAETTISIALLSANVLLSSILLVYEQENEEHHDRNSKDIVSKEYCGGASVLCDCSTIKANGYAVNGVHRIYVNYSNQRYYANAYCDMTMSNGAWTIFQRRKDGTVDFFRGWNDYANGFGNPNEEFWLGNNFIHYLSSTKRYRLRIDLEDFDGQKRYAEYSKFKISSAADKFRLSIGTHSGNAGGDSLTYHNGEPFTAKDADNDNRPFGNCAEERRGGWWYSNCHYANLNGMYQRGRYSSTDCTYCGITWHHWHGDYYSLKTTEMKITPIA